MCGIMGYVTKKTVELTEGQQIVRRNIATGLLIAMEERGKQSTGIAVVRNDELYIKKCAKPAQEFVYWKKVRNIMLDNPNVLIGHTRFATTGAISDANAHPFLKGNICGVHNGMVSNYSELDNTAIVDSEAIFSTLDKHDGKIDAFNELSGSMAVAWIDIRTPNRLRLVAHTNPIAICRVKGLETVFFCSTVEAMNIVMHSATGYAHEQIFEPTEDIVYTIDEDTKITKEKATFKPTTYAVVPYAWEKDGAGYDDEPKTYWQVRRQIQEDMDATPCEMCGKLHDELKDGNRFEDVMFDMDMGSWICHECASTQGKMGGDYIEMAWYETINTQVDMWDAEQEAEKEQAKEDQWEQTMMDRAEAEEADEPPFGNSGTVTERAIVRTAVARSTGKVN